MAGRLRSIKKRASRLFHRDHAPNLSEGAIPPNNDSSADASVKPRHWKSLSLLSRKSKSDQTEPPPRDDFLAHPAVHPLAADPAPRTPRLERPKPGLDFASPVENRSHHSSKASDASSRLAMQQTDRERRLSHSADPEDLHDRLSRPAITQETDPPTTKHLLQDSDMTQEAQYELVNDQVLAATNDEAGFRLQNTVDIDHTVHPRTPVVHEQIKPHVHTIYEPKRTRSIHHHEHRTYIQPIADPDPTILPEQHWLQTETGEMYRIPDELGRKLM
ncbi:hypothetical protein FSOLCH5_005496 [Fusarium solani]|uniref:Uncharacterized protein n=1 Tax=Fusarium solani TaxID=169388 RepID=A0A9P9RE90_FUSSL|nr:uncharacterized protein B0J15DRAFT_24897 [Fusarium solani]KAH7275782.1 hypothetical protein B0J15DRAFT_24897 [Fusarium solani]KAJ4227170.1 hypothetical protein NW759_004539 [Fusarium solani]